MFFVPIIALVGQGVQVGEETVIHPAIAPALVMVGFLMLRLVSDIDWSDAGTAIPCFLIIVGIPLTFSIAAGIGFGIIGYVAVMVVQRRAREVPLLMWLLVPLFVAFFLSGWLEREVF